jgi:ribose 5-phosphate isomerase B
VSATKAERGVLVCGTGIGMAMAANKVPGIRAALCSDAFSARMSREHNDANVLTLGARLTGRETAVEILQTWLTAEFAGGRHSRRLQKLADLEMKMRGEAEPL